MTVGEKIRRGGILHVSHRSVRTQQAELPRHPSLLQEATPRLGKVKMGLGKVRNPTTENVGFAEPQKFTRCWVRIYIPTLVIGDQHGIDRSLEERPKLAITSLQSLFALLAIGNITAAIQERASTDRNLLDVNQQGVPPTRFVYNLSFNVGNLSRTF